MKLGITMFPTDQAIAPADLGESSRHGASSPRDALLLERLGPRAR